MNKNFYIRIMCYFISIMVILSSSVIFVYVYFTRMNQHDAEKNKKKQIVENAKILAMYCDEFYEKKNYWPGSVRILEAEFPLISSKIEDVEYYHLVELSEEVGFGFVYVDVSLINKVWNSEEEDTVVIKFPFFSNLDWNDEVRGTSERPVGVVVLNGKLVEE